MNLWNSEGAVLISYLTVFLQAPDSRQALRSRQPKHIHTACPPRTDILNLPSTHAGDGSRIPSLRRGRPCSQGRSLNEPNWTTPYASIAEFESSSLRRSPRLIMLAIMSNRKLGGVVRLAEFARPLEDAPSNVERLLKQVGVGHARKTAPQPKCSYTGQGHGRAVMAWEQHIKC